MKTIELWHGSAHHIGKPSFGFGKTYKDFGLGFYCTENLALAKEWACSEQHSGYANHYSLTLDDLIILNLSDDKYTILNWLALLVANRQFQVSTPVARQGIEYLKTLRKAIGMSQQELSKKSNVSLRSIQLYEQRQKSIDKAQAITLYRLAQTIGCQIEDLLEFADSSQ